MQTPKARSSPPEVQVPKRVSPRAVRQLKITATEPNSATSSNQTSRTPKEGSPKVIERRSPRSPVPSEAQKKRSSRLSELEVRLSQVQEDLKKAKDQLSSSESWKKQAQQDAEESKQQFLAMSSKLEESQKQLQERKAAEETRVIELQKSSQERDTAWQTELEAVQKQHSVDSATLASATSEILRLKVQLEAAAANTNYAESVHDELLSLKENLAQTLSVVEDMKNQIRDGKESEARAQALVSETLLQLETATVTVETLRLDGVKSMEAYNSIASELEQSRARVNLLEGLVSKLKADFIEVSCNGCQNPAGDRILDHEIGENGKMGESNQLQAELSSVTSEVTKLKDSLEAAKVSYHEEQIRSTVEIKGAFEILEQIKSTSSQRMDELETELEKTKAEIDELKASLMDKETELQAISEDNEVLNARLEKSLSCQREYELEKDLKRSKEDVAELKANLMDKETELQNISEENETLKLELKRKETDKDKSNDEVFKELEVARGAEQEAVTKLIYVTEEAEKSSRRAARVTEQLDAAQATNAEMGTELRRLKVQSDQWRKAAEAAAAMISAGHQGKIMDRTGSLDSNYNPVIASPYSEDMDDDVLKKKNGNMLKKFGGLWKKPQN